MSNVEASSLSFQKISCFRTNVPLFYEGAAFSIGHLGEKND